MACCLRLPAQEVLLTDSATVYPFEGSIHYRIAYAGVHNNLKPLLPDSMVVWVKPPYLRLRYYGGLADSMLHTVQWNRETEDLYLWGDVLDVVYTPAEEYRPEPPRVRKSASSEGVLGYPCDLYAVAVPGGAEKLWGSDSLWFPVAPADSNTRYRPPFMLGGLKVLPLKHVSTQGRSTVTTTATEVRPGLTEDRMFHLPSGYARERFNIREIRHPMIRRRK